MVIGLLKEKSPETRIALLAEHVEELTQQKVTVQVESGAGEMAFTPDTAYEAAGAKLALKADVLKQANLILKIEPPDAEELDQMEAGKILLSVINPLVNKELTQQFVERNLTVFSLDLVPRITRAQSMDILSSMATVAGYKAVLDAAMRLPSFFPMFMSAAGTIRPAKVLVLGAGVAGLQAIATARKLGAVVEAFDVRSAVKEEVNSLGAKFIEVEGAKEDVAAGGYAVEQSEDYKRKQKALVQEHAAKANVIITTAQIPGRPAPLLVSRETVEAMRPGSVIIDLAAVSGGNCELTQNNKVISHKGITIVGESNYPAKMPFDASKMFGKNVNNFLKLLIGSEGELQLNFEDEIVKGTCLVHNGEIINERVKNAYNQ